MNADGDFAYCPIFDQGAGLLSDTAMDYPLEGEVHEWMRLARAKTICADFDEQLELSEKLYGKNLRFTFTRQHVTELLDHADIYSECVRMRVQQIIYEQMRKYAYLFN